MLTITAFIVPLKLRTKGEVGYAAPSGSLIIKIMFLRW